jgi:hypothetical protein
MGGFSAQVQQPQTGQPSGKGGHSVGQAFDEGAGSPPADPNTSPKPLDGVQNGYFAQSPQPMGKGGVQSNSATSGQPRMGQQNQYSNTVGQWDNTQQQTQQPMQGKGKGA